MVSLPARYDSQQTTSPRRPQRGLTAPGVSSAATEELQVIVEGNERSSNTSFSSWLGWLSAITGVEGFQGRQRETMSFFPPSVARQGADAIFQFASRAEEASNTALQGTDYKSAFERIQGATNHTLELLSQPRTVLAHSMGGQLLAAMIRGASEASFNVGGWTTEAERIVRDLGRLKPGWASPDSQAPLADAIDDIEVVTNMLPADTAQPAVEVDDGDGYVSLIWRRAEGRSLSLVFNGKHEVIGTLSPTDDYMPWKLSVFNELEIATKLDHEDVRATISCT